MGELYECDKCNDEVSYEYAEEHEGECDLCGGTYFLKQEADK